MVAVLWQREGWLEGRVFLACFQRVLSLRGLRLEQRGEFLESLERDNFWRALLDKQAGLAEREEIVFLPVFRES